MIESMEELIATIAESDASDFYRTLWGDERAFKRLPRCTPLHLVKTPLRERTYKKEKGLVKIVRRDAGAFLVERALSDIAAENYRGGGKRPLVLLSDSYDSLEKSLWYYEHETLPLIGEHANLPVSVFAAKRYRIDALMTDEAMLARFLQEAGKEYPPGQIALTLLGGEFSAENIVAISSRFHDLRLVLCLSETGALGSACPEGLSSGTLVFHPEQNVFLEYEDGALVISKRELLVTPLVRYKTGIRAAEGHASCACGTEAFRLL